MSFNEVEPGLWLGSLCPQRDALARLWRDHGARIIVAHPTYNNGPTVGAELRGGIAAAARNFGGRPVSFVVSDGTWTAASGDRSTLELAEVAAREALAALPAQERALVQVVLTPYEGYGGDRTPGKGSALKLLFDEMGLSPEADLLVLLDGDLRNDMAAWHGVYAAVEAEHRAAYGERPLFITARYARHFIDASLTRFIVGPLTTLLGRYVPGGISGDIVLSAGAVAHERQSAWTEARRKYGTDISTTFDNIADDETVIYEVYLGAKLHDITDEAKLSVMPGEVIGAALERLRYWEEKEGLVREWLRPGKQLQPLELWGPGRTGIGFIDPGFSDMFNIDAKVSTLLDRYPDFTDDIRLVLGDDDAAFLAEQRQDLAQLRLSGRDDREVLFLCMTPQRWTTVLHKAVAQLLRGMDLEPIKRCLSYLYTAAFLEGVKDRLAELGLTTLGQVRAAQGNLGVPAHQAEAFYRDRVDGQSEALAMGFFQGRETILEMIRPK